MKNCIWKCSGIDTKEESLSGLDCTEVPSKTKKWAITEWKFLGIYIKNENICVSLNPGWNTGEVEKPW